MTNNAYHDLTLPQINKLVIVQFKKGPNVKSLLMRLPKFCMLFKFPSNTSCIIRSLVPMLDKALRP